MDTKRQIIGSALEILKTEGTEGLTLRKVAAGAGMSLGNLQYHYRNKPALFGVLAEHYFVECSELLKSYQPLNTDHELAVRIRHLISFFLDHLDHLTDMCRIFRELWALAARDQVIQDQLIAYYKLSFREMENLFLQITNSPDSSRDIVAILMPYFEGYSITHDALAHDKQAIADLLTRVTTGCLG